ncbi:MAG: N-acyl homoserine lactonase family protein, partial [Deltaproteobacteria bacterium]|nr:N-acyl homoserine lactonase family protein [Deltaproteobacteria bacterium]
MISYTIRPLNTGHQYLDKSQYTTFRRNEGEMIDLPVFAYLVEGNGRKILVDTGMADTERSKQYHH